MGTVRERRLKKWRTGSHDQSTMSSMTATVNNDVVLADACRYVAGRSCPSSPLVKKRYRLVVLGSSQTGKTCVVNRFLENEFTDKYLPTIENFHRKLYKIKSDIHQLDIVDTSGNDPFPASKRLSLIYGDLFIIVCSTDNEQSAKEVFSIAKQICESKEKDRSLNRTKIKLHTPIVIALNKTDLPAQRCAVNVAEIRRQIETLRFEQPCCTVTFTECSAKTGDHVDEVFANLFKNARLPKQMSPYIRRLLEQQCSVSTGTTNKSPSLSPLSKLKNSVIKQNSFDTQPKEQKDTQARRHSLRTDLFLRRGTRYSLVKDMLPCVESQSSENLVPGSSGERSDTNARCVIS